MRLICFRWQDGQGEEEAEEGFHSTTNFRVWGEVPGLKKNKNNLFEYSSVFRLSLYHVSGKEIFDLYGNGNAGLQFRCYPSAGVFITKTSPPYLIIIFKSSSEKNIFLPQVKTWYQNRRTKWKQVNIPFFDGLVILGKPPINLPLSP